MNRSIFGWAALVSALAWIAATMMLATSLAESTWYYGAWAGLVAITAPDLFVGVPMTQVNICQACGMAAIIMAAIWLLLPRSER